MRGLSCGRAPARIRFIWCASCQVRRITSPIRPIPWESELMMLIAPRSCRHALRPHRGIADAVGDHRLIARDAREFMPCTDHIMA